MRASDSRGPDDDRVRVGVRADRVQRPLGDDGEPAALAGREPPVAPMLADHGAALVDDRAGRHREAAPLEEEPVVVAGEEARLLALRAPAAARPARCGLRARLVLL